jgi:hypothetical protein
LAEAAAYLEETGERLDEYLELDGDRSRELFGVDQPPPQRAWRPAAGGDGLVAVTGPGPAGGTGGGGAAERVRLPRPNIPRELPAEQPQLLPEELGGQGRGEQAGVGADGHEGPGFGPFRGRGLPVADQQAAGLAVSLGAIRKMDAFIWANFPLKPLPERLVG